MTNSIRFNAPILIKLNSKPRSITKAKNAIDPSENVFAKDIGESTTENASNTDSEKNPITDDESGENRANEENQIDNDSEDSDGREPASSKEDLSEPEEQGDDK